MNIFSGFLGAGLLSLILKAVITFAVGYVIICMVMKAVRAALEKSKLEKAAHTLILSLFSTVLYVLLGLIIAKGLGLDITSIVALASVLTLAVSLALQTMLSNVVGGFTILYNHSFHSGDVVEVAGQTGTVKEINMAYTILSTPDNKVISIPNSAVVGSQIVNYSTSDTRRVDFAVSASYEAPTQKVLDALVLAGTVDNAMLDPAPFSAITDYGESAINYTLRVWVKNADYWDVYFAVNKRIKDIFDEQNIEMTYPHLNVHLQQ